MPTVEIDQLLINRIVNLAVAIQQIPAPTFREMPRADFIYQQFIDEGLLKVCKDEVGNVYACLPGVGDRLPLIVTAHLDTVFPRDTDLKITVDEGRVSGAGIGDNSFGLAGLFALVWSLRQQKQPLPGDVWLVANVCEEGLGDLRGMRAVVDRFGKDVLAYVVLEGMSLGYIYFRGLGVRRYLITVNTPGGHSWVDFGKPSAIHELAKLISHLGTLNLPEEPRTSLNVGVIQGGTSVNTIAAEAHMELDLRSEDVHVLKGLINQVESLVSEVNSRGDGLIQARAEVIGDRPVGEIAVDHPLVQLAISSLKAQGITAQLNIGSTDANIPLSLGLPAICLGLTTGGGAHTTQEYALIPPLTQGLAQLVAVVRGAFNLVEAV